MPIVDHAARLITCNLVLFGPARAGKTTNLTWLHAALPGGQVGPLTSVATRHGRSHAFAYRPADLPELGAFQVAFHLRTVAADARRGASRESLLAGADGIAFIADSHRERIDDNLASLRDLSRILERGPAAPFALPMVLQCNKQDLPMDERVDPAELTRMLALPAPVVVPAQAQHGLGVRETVQALSELVLTHLGAATVTPRWAA